MSKRLGERLIEAGLTTAAAVEQALEQQRLTGHKLGDSLVEMGLVSEATLLRFLASEFQTRYVSAEKLGRAQIPTELLDRVPVRLAEANHLLPLAIDEERGILSVVAAEPQNEGMLRELALVAEVEEVFAYVGLRSVILAGIQKHYYGDPTAFSALSMSSRAASRSDLAGIASAYESSGSGRLVSPPPAPLRLRGEGSNARFPHTVVRGKSGSQANALVSMRGTVGESDYLETLRVLVEQLEQGREELRGHSAQLARQASLVALRMALPARDVTCVALAAFLHDLGKGAQHLTLAGTSRDPERKAEAKRTALAPLQMFESVHLPAQVGATLAQLYEAFDGSGTPQGVRGDDICIGARVLAAVDSYLDLTKSSRNAWGRRFTREQALQHMAERAGTLYDPRVVQTLEQLHSGEMLRQRLAADGRMVLVAEPDATAREGLSQGLGRRGLVVQATGTLDGAAELALSGEADAWILSLGLGAAELLDLTSHLRVQSHLAGTPLVVTGDPDAEMRERLLNAGVTVLVPSQNPAEVAYRVSQLVDERIAHGAPAHAVQGTFEELGPRELLRVLGNGRKSGRLTVRGEGDEGILHVEAGRLTYASFHGKRAEEALTELLRERPSEFVFDPDGLLLELPHLDTDLEVVVRALEASGATREEVSPSGPSA